MEINTFFSKWKKLLVEFGLDRTLIFQLLNPHSQYVNNSDTLTRCLL